MRSPLVIKISLPLFCFQSGAPVSWHTMRHHRTPRRRSMRCDDMGVHSCEAFVTIREWPSGRVGIPICDRLPWYYISNQECPPGRYHRSCASCPCGKMTGGNKSVPTKEQHLGIPGSPLLLLLIPPTAHKRPARGAGNSP